MLNCDNCEALMINGIFCHETGCPTGKATPLCKECGNLLTDDNELCCFDPERDLREYPCPACEIHGFPEDCPNCGGIGRVYE